LSRREREIEESEKESEKRGNRESERGADTVLRETV